MRSGTAPAKPYFVLLATRVAVKRAQGLAGLFIALLAGLVLAGCSVTIGPQPTPGAVQPGEVTNTPIQQVQVDITHVPTPTVGAPTVPVGSPGVETKYSVKAGDTLSGIADQFGVTVEDIVKYNNITDPNNIFEGEVLTIPPKGAVALPAATNGVATPTAGSSPAATMVP